jgi:predicted alpha/beta-fold hydrolase
VLGTLRKLFPERSLCAVGVSLGGNVLLKFLGEVGEQGNEILRAAAAISVPFDLSAGASFMERGFSRLYRWSLVGRLKRKVRAKAALLRGLIDVDRTLAASTFHEFDDASTAPLHGFRDAEEYYRLSSSAQYIGKILVPTMLIHSTDDPFLPANAVPQDAARENPQIECRFTAHGGHVGFVEGPPWAPRFWAERTVSTFFSKSL